MSTIFIFLLGLHTGGRIAEPRGRITSKTSEIHCQIAFLECCKEVEHSMAPAI